VQWQGEMSFRPNFFKSVTVFCRYSSERRVVCRSNKKRVEGVVQIFGYGVCMLNGSTAAACVFVALIAS
jgi:hypothetical protein